jgi:hypothetical protein
MAGCQAKTFQCAPSVHASNLVSCCVVARKTATTSFLISCDKCLWDVVGRFLGRCLQLIKPLPAVRYSHVCSLRKQGCYDQFK